MPFVNAVTRLPFERFRARVDEAISRSFAAPVISANWVGRTLEVRGPGCYAIGEYRVGRFSGSVDLFGPGVLMRAVVLAEMDRILLAGGCDRIDVF